LSAVVAHPYKLATPGISNAPSTVSVYPNPTTGIVRLSAPSLKTNTTITICDIMGRTLLAAQYNFGASATTTIDMNIFAAGIYFVKVVSESGSAQVVKLVKE
jgi:hypothetical protein